MMSLSSGEDGNHKNTATSSGHYTITITITNHNQATTNGMCDGERAYGDIGMGLLASNDWRDGQIFGNDTL